MLRLCRHLGFVFILFFSAIQAIAQEKVILDLKWAHQFQFAGYYAAKEMGYYQEAGFDVEFRENRSSKDPIDAVLNGAADFGVSDSSLILQRLNGRPVVVLGAIFQHSPLVLLTRSSDGPMSPYELKGKRVMYNKSTDDAALIGMFHELGFSEKDIIHVPLETKLDIQFQALLEERVDAIAVYLTNEPYFYQKKGLKTHVISPLNYGIDLYGDMLFASEEVVRDNPEKARLFLEASLRGWEYAMDHPAEVIGWIKDKYTSAKSLDHLEYEASQTAKMILPKEVELGYTNRSRFLRISNIYKRLGLVPETADLEGILLTDHLAGKAKIPYWVKGVVISAILLSLLALGLVIVARHLKRQVQKRTQELDQANRDLARYVGIVDQYVISSQTDEKGVITDVSRAFCLTSGYSKEELIGQPHTIVQHPDTGIGELTDLWEEAKKGRVWSGICKNQHKNGSAYWIECNIDPIVGDHGGICGYVSIGQDISDKKRIEQLSITDKLTGLYNRLHLDTVLDAEFERLKRYGGDLSLILCDIDHFKQINDTYGHLKGDQVLSDVSELLKTLCRKADVVGRWGGEEFVIVCPETPLAGAMALAEKLRLAINALEFPDIGYQSASFGVALATTNMSVDEAIAAADSALYRAKAKGRNCVAVFGNKSDSENAHSGKSVA